GNETDMTKMGGLRNKLPVTYKVFLIGALALSGVPLLSGFFSKDEILWKTVSSPFGSFKLWFVGAAVAGLTAFYAFRLIFLTFHGKSRVSKEVAEHIHESPPVMTVPLGILAFLSIIGGYVGIPHVSTQFEHFLDPVFSRYMRTGVFEGAHDLVGLELGFMGISILIAFLGIGFAYLLYITKPQMVDEIYGRAKGLYKFLASKWYVDEIYDKLLVRPLNRLSDIVLWRWLDVRVIDGLVNQVAKTTGQGSNLLRRIQTGIIQNYALSIILGVIILVGYFLVI
ncbi:MAG: proton-conducting transporter membrane subunit, partial [bacterium]